MPSSFRYQCPECDAVFSACQEGRARCSSCINRVFVSDLDRHSQQLWEAFGTPVGYVTGGGHSYKTKAVRTNRDLAEGLMGSSNSIGDEIYLHVWLLAQHDGSNVDVLVGDSKIAELPASKSRSLQEAKRYTTVSAEPLACGRAILRVPGRLVVQEGSKRILYVCAVEEPETPPAKKLPFAAIQGELANVTGRLSNAMLDAKGVTCRQAMTYVQMSDSEARSLRNNVRANPSGPKYFFLPSDLMREYPILWRSDDRRFEVRIDVKNPERSEIFAHTFLSLAVSWIHGVPPAPTGVKPAIDPEPQSRTPKLWRDLGRTATLAVTESGKQVPATPGSASFCHCWSWVQGLAYPNNDGSSRAEIANEVGKDERLVLRREPNNPHDRNAIAVLTQGHRQMGYLPRELSSEIVAGAYTAAAYVRERTNHELASGAIATLRVVVDAGGNISSHESGGGLMILVVLAAGEKDEKKITRYAERVMSTPDDPDW